MGSAAFLQGFYCVLRKDPHIETHSPATRWSYASHGVLGFRYEACFRNSARVIHLKRRDLTSHGTIVARQFTRSSVADVGAAWVGHAAP